jgi:hypothetical protein
MPRKMSFLLVYLGGLGHRMAKLVNKVDATITITRVLLYTLYHIRKYKNVVICFRT